MARIRRRGVTLPVYAGLPGPVDMPRLVRIATRAGLGESARFLRGHGGWTRLLVPGAYRPDRLLSTLAGSLADPALRVAGLHVFTFNEVARAERWRQGWLSRLS